MDIVTHGLSGILLGKATRDKFKKIPPKILVWFFAFSSIFPDFDIIFRLFSEQLYLKNHRGITHSLILLPIWSFLITAIYCFILKWKLFLKKHTEEIPSINKNTIFELYVISSFGILFHISCDLITTYGTMILSPFDNSKFAYGSVFIIDFIFSGIIIGGIAISQKYSKYSYKPKVSQFFLLLLIFYVGITQVLKSNALEKARENFYVTNKIKNTSFEAFPQPLSPFKWKVFTFHPENEYFYYAHVDLFNTNENIKWESTPKWGKTLEVQSLAKTVWLNKDFSLIRNFFSLPTFHSLEEKPNKICLFFQDLKFSNSYTNNPFIYGLCYYESGVKSIEKLEN